MKVSVITINYNSSKDTLKLLKSLNDQTDHGFETIVVDNASEESDLESLNDYLSRSSQNNGQSGFKLIKNSENLGFSGGNNSAIREALKNGSDWVILLNNDTWTETGFIASLKPKLELLEGIAGVPLDEGGHIAYAGKISWLKNEGRHIYDQNNILLEKNRYVIGGGMAIHKDVFEKIGLLDEKYFLYFEDQDFSLRAARTGFKLNVLTEIKAYHQPSSSTKKLGSPLLLRYHCRNALYFNLKNGPWYIKILVWPWSFWIITKQSLKLLFRYQIMESTAIFLGVMDFYKNKMGKIKTI